MSLLLLAVVVVCKAQRLTERGFLETESFGYPQAAPGDSGLFVSEALLRVEGSYQIFSSLQISAGLDATTDSHRQTERSWHLDWLERGVKRPAFTIRRLELNYTRGRLNITVGQQLIRWGKADILNPTDRFAPKDFLNVVDSDYLSVPATRINYGGQSNSVDLVWQPFFTPSRMPLIGQRWAPLANGLLLVDLGAHDPGGPNLGIRFNHIGARVEYSLSFFNGHNHLPVISVVPLAAGLGFMRAYPQLRMYGGDAAIPLRWFTVKTEAAYLSSASQQADEYALYVIQLERPVGEWSFTGGYAGEFITRHGAVLDFAPDRGLSRAFLGRAGYTIDSNRSVALETAVRQTGRASWLKVEYSQAVRSHWRATVGIAWIRGDPADFLGEYYRNSHAYLKLRYSF